MELRDAVDRLRGDEGTDVTIKVRQPGARGGRGHYTITRGQHPRQTITGWHKLAAGNWDVRMSESDPIAYLQDQRDGREHAARAARAGDTARK